MGGSAFSRVLQMQITDLYHGTKLYNSIFALLKQNKKGVTVSWLCKNEIICDNCGGCCLFYYSCIV